jgi:hypothetical protein
MVLKRHRRHCEILLGVTFFIPTSAAVNYSNAIEGQLPAPESSPAITKVRSTRVLHGEIFSINERRILLRKQCSLYLTFF